MLDDYRREINEIDAKLKELFLQRQNVVKKVALYKKTNSLPILDQAREQAVLQSLTGGDKFLRQYFRAIMDICKNAEINLLLGKNIVLIGMMGAGKTTVGKRLSNLLSLPFIDIDKQIQSNSGMTISEIFSKYGEDEFRKIESEVLQSLPKYKSTIISTGGGIIKNPENMELLKKDGIVFFLNRPPRAIAIDLKTSTRPLLKSRADIYNIYSERLPLYKKYADYTVYGNYSLDSATGIIVNTLITKVL
jgi:shikimate kinase